MKKLLTLSLIILSSTLVFCKYDCLGQQCLENAKGRFPTLNDCLASCKGAVSTKYDCLGQQCVSNANGLYSSLQSCQSSGCEGASSTKYDCLGGQCKSNSNGKFSTLTACQLSGCQPTQSKYTCDKGSCTEGSIGQFSSLSDCQSSCAAPAKKYECSSGSCSESSSGTFSSLTDCQSSCAQSSGCSAYGQGTCSTCGNCFNPKGRDGVQCPDSKTAGYYCADELNFACMDWSFGSKSIKQAEAEFNSKNNDNVFFGVGSYGSNDPMQGIGGCYRMKVDGVERDLLLQSINTGSDVAGNQFDLMQGDGGTGAFNWCAGSDFAIYPGDNSAWGAQYGGWPTRDGCKKLPEYPKKKTEGVDYDNLIELCEYAFDHNVRGPNGENPTIRDLARVECPVELYQFTQIKRKDDPKGFTFDAGKRQEGFPYSGPKCLADGHTLSYCLTRMMDCRKPSGAFKDNIKEELVDENYKLVQICINDGYTRMDNKCGCKGCYC